MELICSRCFWIFFRCRWTSHSISKATGGIPYVFDSNLQNLGYSKDFAAILHSILKSRSLLVRHTLADAWSMRIRYVSGIVVFAPELATKIWIDHFALKCQDASGRSTRRWRSLGIAWWIVHILFQGLLNYRHSCKIVSFDRKPVTSVLSIKRIEFWWIYCQSSETISEKFSWFSFYGDLEVIFVILWDICIFHVKFNRTKNDTSRLRVAWISFQNQRFDDRKANRNQIWSNSYCHSHFWGWKVANIANKQENGDHKCL